MAAKKVTEYHVTAKFTSAKLATDLVALVQRLHGTGEIVEHPVHVCPHAECGKPWPMLDEAPRSHASYRRGVESSYKGIGSPSTYCCEATKADCRGTK